MNYISGEKIQSLAQHFLDFSRNDNPNLINDKRWITFSANYDNPMYVYIKSEHLSKINMDWFKNPVVLIAHNSDENITEKYLSLLEHPKLLHLFSQNVCINHNKCTLLPIGIANSMWGHGNLQVLDKVVKNMPPKDKHMFFNFSIATNPHQRNLCKQKLQNIYSWNPSLPFEEYLVELAHHQYCICPDGNGADTHRLWECVYLDVIPICLNSTFTRRIKETYLPQMILVDKWEDVPLKIPEIYKTPNQKVYVETISEKIYEL